MAELKDLIKGLIDQAINEMHVALPARINTYDPINLKAEITLLAQKTLNGKPVTVPPIIEVPVAVFKAGPFIIRPPYVPGDIVQVIFNERALDNLLITGNPQEPKLNRKFSLDDAVIISGLKVENQPALPEEYSDSLYIANLNAGSKVVVKPNGDIILEASQIFLGEGATERVPLGLQLQAWLNKHSHPYSWGHDPGNGTTGPPIEAPSPDPSSIVKVK